MEINQLKDGNRFGSHRVIEPKGTLPQPADKIDNDVNIIWDNEILVNVESLNIDSASFAQIKKEAENDEQRIKDIILNIVNTRGKLQNPVTGSGGIFIGSVEYIGDQLTGKCNISKGDKVISLVSLSLTPLKIFNIYEVKSDVAQIRINGKAILFESSIYASLPDDLPAPLVLAVLDVCGAPAQTSRLVKPGDTVVIIGAAGKSGILCAYEARNIVGKSGKVIGICQSEKSASNLESTKLCDYVLRLDARNALSCYNWIMEITDTKLSDVVINCVNIPNTELASILMCRERGKIYFFSMATSFTKAALGAEGVGKDIEMIIGNGYAKGHAEMALNIVRRSKEIRDLYESFFCQY